MTVFAATIGLPEVLLVVGILLLLFGARRLPEVGRGLGSGMREFRDSVRGKDREGRAALEPGDGDRENADEPLEGEVVRERR